MKFPTLFRLISLALAVGLTLGACAPAAAPAPAASPLPPTAASLTLTDGLGNTLTLAKPAEHIVSLAPSNTEILYAVGAGGQVVGRDEFSDYPAEAKSLPSVGGSMGKFDLEAIAKMKPDLVLASGFNTPDLVKSIQDLKIPVYYLQNPTTLDEMYANLITVGRLTGREANAQDLVTSLKNRVKAVAERLGDVKDRPVVFYELDGTDPAKPYTSGPGTFIDQLIAMAGGQNAGAKLSQQWAQISLEQVVVVNPDIIFLGDGAYGVTPDMVAARPGWSVIKAVQQKKIYDFDDNTVSRPTNRLVDALENLAKVIHPEKYQ